jgi:uncharacterized short protein YbdD (DUF466 family)
MNIFRVDAVEIARSAWIWLRQVSGDAAYDNYLHSLRRADVCDSAPRTQPRTAPLSRADFYLDALRRRYSSVSRCC